MPLWLLLRALDLAGWAASAGGLLAAALLLSWGDGRCGAVVAAVVFGAGVAAGLMLMGFAANLRLISALLERSGGVAPRLPR